MDKREKIVGCIDFSDPSVLNTPPLKERMTPVIVTLADNEDITTVDIRKMMEGGMNIARFKITHVNKGDKLKLLGKVDKAAQIMSSKFSVDEWPVATCIDLRTCICKSGIPESEEYDITLDKNSDIILTCDIEEYNKCNKYKIFVDNPYLTVDVTVDMEISLDLDNVVLRCTMIMDENSIKCMVIKGGIIKSMCNVSFKGMKHSRPYLMKKDTDIIKFALEYQIDIITINYVRNVETLKKAKQYMGKNVKRPILLGSLCTQQCLDNIDEIIKEADGIVLSREYLSYELESSQRYRITQIQKWVGAKCQQAGKPYFLSGGVLQDLLLAGNFCDNEIADITNALLDGVTGFILKDCDNISNVLEALKVINDVCRTVEPLSLSKADFWRITDAVQMPLNAAEAAVMSCTAIAKQVNAGVIVVPTVTGRTAKALLTMRPLCLIITICNNTRVCRLLQTYRCVVPLMYNGPSHQIWNLAVEARISYAIEYGVKRGWLIYGDTYVTLQRGTECSSFCDMIRLWKVTISKKNLVECDDPFEIKEN